VDVDVDADIDVDGDVDVDVDVNVNVDVQVQVHVHVQVQVQVGTPLCSVLAALLARGWRRRRGGREGKAGLRSVNSRENKKQLI